MQQWLSKLLLSGLIAFALSGFNSIEARAADKVKMLMVTQSAGFVHGSVNRKEQTLAPAEVAMIQLGQQSGAFEVDCTQDCAADFTRENLQNYDVVLFYTTGNLPIADADLEYFFKEWLTSKGHGFIGIHSASDTFHEYEPYWDMVGGTFNGHPWNANGTVTMTIHNPENPMMAPFGNQLVIQDEIYQYKNWQPEKVHVLMSINMSETEVKRPYHVPVSWIKQYGEGRVYYNNLGHREETWANPQFRESLLQGIKWVTGQTEADASPNPEVSAEQEELAKKAAPAE